MQDLTLSDILPQMVALSEAYFQVYEMKEGGIQASVPLPAPAPAPAPAPEAELEAAAVPEPVAVAEP